MEIAVILFAVFVIAVSVFNIGMAIKKKKIKLAVFNGILYGVIALLFVIDGIDSAIISDDSLNYSIYSDGILGSIRYDRTEDGYHIIKRTGFFYSAEVAVPVENTDISAFTKIYKPVHIYCIKDTSLGDKQITINSKAYEFCDTVVKIRPSFLELIIVVGLIDIFVLTIYNLILFGVNLYTKNTKAKFEA